MTKKEKDKANTPPLVRRTTYVEMPVSPTNKTGNTPPLERRTTYVGMPTPPTNDPIKKESIQYIDAGKDAVDALKKLKDARNNPPLQTNQNTEPMKKSPPPIPNKTGAALEMAARLRAEREAREAITSKPIKLPNSGHAASAASKTKHRKIEYKSADHPARIRLEKSKNQNAEERRKNVTPEEKAKAVRLARQKARGDLLEQFENDEKKITPRR